MTFLCATEKVAGLGTGLGSMYLLEHLGLVPDGVFGDEGGSDLLGDAPGLPVLDMGATNLVQDLRLAGVDVPEDTHHGGAEEIDGAFFFVPLTTILPWPMEEEIC